jgi:alkylation response protein AidB-like acyl-CoA dehydrogenase
MYLRDLLTEEEIDIQELFRKFVDREIMPRRRELEDNPVLVSEILQKITDMGVLRMGYPLHLGGENNGKIPFYLTILAEEFARGDAGIAMAVGQSSGRHLGAAIAVKNQAIIDRFLPIYLGNTFAYSCLSMSEPDGGCDVENFDMEGTTLRTVARLDGDEWIINGCKCWPGSGGMAAMYLTVCTTDPSAGSEGIAIIYVPDKTPGLSFGKPEQKMGFQSISNASVYYEDVRVPREYRLAGPGKDADFFKAACAHTKIHSAALSLGISRGVLETVLEYTKNRKGGGKSVRQHTIIAGIIADMAVKLETSRALTYNATWMLSRPDVYGPAYSVDMTARCNIAKVFTADAVVWIANKAMELMGANGYSPEYHVEKYLRDGKSLQLWLAGQQVSRYDIARGYYDFQTVHI